ncbi:endonuclease/exonuclease/phosphatase family protein [Polaribacter sp. Asnod1-A03]|uniref:endonuclease/exonuclease/phosphatase family protein n=1 Tax=Polaribacter sp. Asnod1-A03 TaxID=3160581 RepID=UPI003866E28A
MWYNDLRPDNELTNNRYSLIMLDNKNNYKRLLADKDKKRIITNIVKLREGLLKEIPSKQVDENLLLASWNIKNFGKIKDRTAESLYYIAETINAFDIVALQEINSDISHFKKVLSILGSYWKHTISDITEGNSGNDERFGFLYDSRRVTLSGLSGEIVIPPEILHQHPIISQLKRTPTFTGFESGWQKFSIISIHLHPGEGTNGIDMPTDHQIRKEEVRLLTEVLKKKLARFSSDDRDTVILGDTNLYKEDTDIVQLFHNIGFTESTGLEGKFTNTSLTQIYDRIFFNSRYYFRLNIDENGKQVGGVFNLFNYVYQNTPEVINEYKELMLLHKNDPTTLISDEKFTSYFNRYWKRDQISDHLPVWIEISTNNSNNFLKSKLSKF